MSNQFRLDTDPREAFNETLDNPDCWKEWNEYLDRVEAEYGDEDGYVRESGIVYPEYTDMGS